MKRIENIMSKIYKYPVEVVDQQEIVVAGVAQRVLSVRIVEGQKIQIWAEVVPDDYERSLIHVQIVWTGMDVPTDMYYLGMIVDGHFVWHVYTKIAHL